MRVFSLIIISEAVLLQGMSVDVMYTCMYVFTEDRHVYSARSFLVTV